MCTRTSLIVTQWGRVQSFPPWTRNYSLVTNWLDSPFQGICEHEVAARAAVGSAFSSQDQDEASLLTRLRTSYKSFFTVARTPEKLMIVGKKKSAMILFFYRYLCKIRRFLKECCGLSLKNSPIGWRLPVLKKWTYLSQASLSRQIPSTASKNSPRKEEERRQRKAEKGSHESLFYRHMKKNSNEKGIHLVACSHSRRSDFHFWGIAIWTLML